MNFEMACEMAEAEGIKTKKVIVAMILLAQKFQKKKKEEVLRYDFCI